MKELDLSKIETALASYRDRSDLILLLQRVQELYGYLPISVLSKIEGVIGVSGAEIFGVATFYTQFKLKPSGKNIVKVCHGTACHVAGSERVEEALRRHLKAEGDEPTADGLFSIERVACLGCCSLAPVVMVNNRVCGRVKPSIIKNVIKDEKNKDREKDH
jgi:NADH-quinone oxidoreductase subunit E